MAAFLKNLARTNAPFLCLCTAFWFFGSIALLGGDEITIQLRLNAFRSSFQDELWVVLTALGSGMSVIFTCLVGGLFSRRYALYTALAVVLAAGTTAAIKYAVDAPRPWTVLAAAGFGDFPRVQGYAFATTPSFPSGHTATAFALFTGLSLWVRKGWIKVGLFFPALAVAFSRIYLMQHFLSDVLAGSFIGVGSAIAVFIAVQNRLFPWPTGMPSSAIFRDKR